MLADLHSHYPMHLLEEWAAGQDDIGPARTIDRVREVERPNKFRAWLLRLLSTRINRQTPTASPRVTVERLKSGDFGLVFSVIYSPFAEIDLDRPFQADPDDSYFGHVEKQIELVDEDLATHADPPRVVRNETDLKSAHDAGVPAIVHCVEGAFHLGESDDAIRANVKTLADAGVAYITVAHLFWRGYAKNVNAIPFIPSPLYWLLFGRPWRIGLSERGKVAVRAMAEHGVMVDIAHMHKRALADTWDLLDAKAPGMPVLATHAGYRFWRRPNPYMLSRDTIERIAAREGLIGLIMGQHLLGKTASFEGSVDLLCRHIDAIYKVTGDYDHVGIGSDLAGFIKPTVSGIEYADDLQKLVPELARRYDPTIARKIAYGNAERVLCALWEYRTA